jgi:hypothetical protein
MVGHDDGGYLIATVYTSSANDAPSLARSARRRTTDSAATRSTPSLRVCTF